MVTGKEWVVIGIVMAIVLVATFISTSSVSSGSGGGGRVWSPNT